jgi:hypothetical protein
MNRYSDTEFRAIAASRKAATIAGGQWQQPSGVYTVEFEGLTYIVLCNVNGVLSVYRVQPNGRLKGLRRWSAGVVAGLV